MPELRLIGQGRVNFYKHHIGDYAQATSHLSFVEDAAYSRLLRKYYAEEKPLPSDMRTLQRLVGARTKEERQAVETVLLEFFTEEADGWHNKRADAELQRANAQAEANRKVAEEREARRRARIEAERASNESNTNRAQQTHESLPASEHESLRSREPSQTPDARHQTPDTTTSVGGERARTRAAAAAPPPRGSRLPADWSPGPEHEAFAEGLGLRNGAAQAELAKFRDYWAAQPGERGRKADWGATWRNWLRRASEDRARRPAPSAGGIDLDGVH